MIDVTMLCIYDWANTGWRFAQCLKMLGLNVFAFKGAYHPFGYPEQIPIHPDLVDTERSFEDGAKCALFADVNSAFLAGICKDSKVIHFRDTCLINTGVDLEEKKVVAQHGGRLYRSAHDYWNNNFGYLIDKTIIQMPDILGHGAPGEALVYYPVQTDHPMLRPDFKKANNGVVAFGHFPTTQIEKGSDMFFNALNRHWNEGRRGFLYGGPTEFEETKSWITVWPFHLERLKQVDVVLETCCMVAQGKPFGEWGNQCIEAASMGKIVITNTLSAELYRKEYGDGFAPRIANNDDDIYRHIGEILEMSDSELRAEKQKHRAWVEKYHSMEATAERLWERIYKDLI